MAGLTVADSDLLVWDPSKTSMQIKLGELVQYFQVGIPTNADGVPKSYIDPTQIFSHLLDVDTPDDLADEVVEAAKIGIDFDDGIPTIEGVPFWERLEGEPMPYYKLFKEYREMKYIGTGNSTGALTRSIAKLSESSNMSGKCLNALARAYHWQVRAKAYDCYKAIERSLAKQRDIELLEGKHAKISNELLDQAVDYLLKHPEQLSPKTAIDLVKLSMEAGRLAVGLNPDKPGTSGGSSGGGTHVQVINQNANVGDGGNAQMANFDLSPVEQKTKENSQDVSHLQSILHVLNTSGAFKEATQDNKNKQDADDIEDDAEDNIIDAEFEETT